MSGAARDTDLAHSSSTAAVVLVLGQHHQHLRAAQDGGVGPSHARPQDPRLPARPDEGGGARRVLRARSCAAAGARGGGQRSESCTTPLWRFITHTCASRSAYQVRNELRALSEPKDQRVSGGKDASSGGGAATSTEGAAAGADAAAGSHARRPTPLAGAVVALGGRLPPTVASFSPPGADTAPAAVVAVAGSSLPGDVASAPFTAAAPRAPGDSSASSPAPAAAADATAPPSSTAASPSSAAAAAAASPEQLALTQLPAVVDAIYPPTHPHLRVVSVEMDSGRAMQSAAKCPFLLTFNVRQGRGRRGWAY